MRIVVASKFWYLRGGLERVMFDEVELLTGAGHEVAAFSTTHPSNVASPWEHYFAPYIELGAGSRAPVTPAQKMLAAVRMFENSAAARYFARLLDDFVPDVVHIHGIHRQISPSILRETSRRRIPVVQTLHDYHHICPADVLLRGGVTPCDPPLCRTVHTLPAISNRCVRDSTAASALSAAETTYQRVRRSYEKGVAAFVAPSRFLADKMLGGSWTVPIHVVPNCTPSGPPHAVSGRGDYFIYAGRLSPEKGVEVLLAAAAEANVHVVIAGDGPLRASLEMRFPAADFRGHLDASGLQGLLAGARAAVVPSVCLENAPMSVLEAMSAGVPVIVSSIGGIPELVRDGVEGLLVPAGQVSVLAVALRTLADDAALSSEMGARGIERVKAEYSPQLHLSRLVSVYDTVISPRRPE